MKKNNNLDNINAVRTPEERKKLASNAGKASVIARRAYKTMREAAMEQGALVIAKDNKGEEKTNIDAVVRKAYELARNGDVRAMELLLKIRGEDVQRMELSAAPQVVVGDFGEVEQ